MPGSGCGTILLYYGGIWAMNEWKYQWQCMNLPKLRCVFCVRIWKSRTVCTRSVYCSVFPHVTHITLSGTIVCVVRLIFMVNITFCVSPHHPNVNTIPHKRLYDISHYSPSLSLPHILMLACVCVCACTNGRWERQVHVGYTIITLHTHTHTPVSQHTHTHHTHMCHAYTIYYTSVCIC